MDSPSKFQTLAGTATTEQTQSGREVLLFHQALKQKKPQPGTMEAPTLTLHENYSTLTWAAGKDLPA
jgi:hypothetical protein